MSGENTAQVKVRLCEMGCKFDETLTVSKNGSFKSFSDSVEALFNQRVLLSFEKKIKAQELSVAVASTVGTEISSIVGSRVKMVGSEKTEVPLNENTWSQFISQNTSLKCKAWSVYPGQPLPDGVYMTKQERLQKFENGTAGYPRDKRLAVLKKKLETLALKEQFNSTSNNMNSRNLDLFRSATSEQRDATVTRLWRHATDRNTKRLEDEHQEFSRVSRRLQLPPRRVIDRSDAEEERLATLFSAPIQRKQQLEEELDLKYSSLVPRPTRGAHPMPLSDLVQTSLRLYNARDQIAQKRELSVQRVHGVAPEEKKLSKDQLKERLNSLYTKAIDKKTEKIQKLSQEYSSPKVASVKISKQKASEVAERLCQPKSRS